jgi:hypothetical protein
MALSPSELGPITEIYSASVKAKIQSGQRLQGIMPEVSNVGGSVRNDWIGTTTEMKETPFGASELATSEVSFTPVVTTPLRFVIKTAIAESDQTLTSVSLQNAHTKIHGMAVARQIDLLKIRAIFENPGIPVGNLTTISKTIGVNTGLNYSKFTAGATMLNNEDNEMNSRFILANSDQYQTLLNDERYTSSRFNDKTLPDYGLKEFAGLNPYMLGKSSSNSLPITKNAGPPVTESSQAVILQYEAMQFMYNMPARTVITYDGTNLNYVIVTELVANAQIMQQPAIVMVNLELDANGQPIAN